MTPPATTSGSHGVTPDGGTAYVMGEAGVTPINTRTNVAGAPIKVFGGSRLGARGKTILRSDKNPSYPERRVAFPRSVSSVGFLWESSLRTRTCGDCVGTPAGPGEGWMNW